MPRVKVDYVVSFSSEHPEHPANNLVAGEVGKKRWLCNPGEPTCSVVLQLARAVQILSVNVGAYNTAFVEVLVGRSEGSSEQFQVLVARSVLLSPGEARRAQGCERVRAFSGRGLAQPAAAQRWDRLRLVCSQPYNRHCEYGLSFVHVYEPEGPEASPVAPAPLPPRPLLPLETYSSSEDEFHPGELFAIHRSTDSDTSATPATIDTETQIRQATSQALKNISESATKLKKTQITKAERKKTSTDRSGREPGEGAAPHQKTPNKEHDTHTKQHRHADNNETRTEQNGVESVRNEKRKTMDRVEKEVKRQRVAEGDGADVAMEAVEEQPLRGVVFSLSGYPNPRRAALRRLALDLGARYQPQWGPQCTHLICAFSRTPKLQQAGAGAGASGAGRVRAARGEWLEAVRERGRRVPWRWFACDPRDHLPPPPPAPRDHLPPPPPAPRDHLPPAPRDHLPPALRDHLPPAPRDHLPPALRDHLPPPPPAPRDHLPPALRDHLPPTPRDTPAQTTSSLQASHVSDCDTDDEIEEVLRKQRKREDRSPTGLTASGAAVGAPEDSDSDETVVEGGGAPAGPRGGLPAFFEGCTFVVAPGPTGALLARYVRAYGGLLLQADDPESQSADYWVGPGCPGGLGGPARVSPAWLWRCHAQRRRLPPF